MPNYEMKCKVCEQKIVVSLPVSLRDDPELLPDCCGVKMARIFSAVPHKWETPIGHYYPTVGKVCDTKEEFQREADKTKTEMRKKYTEEEK